MKENNYKITRLENSINELKDLYRPGNCITNNQHLNTWNFPIKTVEELENFEEKLNDDEFKSNIVSFSNNLFKIYI